MNIQRLSASSALLVIFLSGCATTQPIPERSQPQSSGFGIEVSLKSPMGIFSSKPDQVYFVKIDGGGILLQQEIISSNYSKDGRAYLLNALPGTYVAVAAFFFSYQLAPGGQNNKTFTTYFSKELVELTKVTVRANDFIFMGSYVVDQSRGFDEADGVQVHYKNVIAPFATTSTILMVLSGDEHYRGTLIERKNDELSRNEFFQRAKEDLAGSAWAERLR